MLDLMDEERITRMIEAGRRIVDAAIALYRPVAIVAAYSGGDDSVVTCHFGVNQYDALAIHCGTGIGLQATEDHIFATCAHFGWPLLLKRAEPEGKPKKTTLKKPWVEGTTAYEEFVLNHGFPGPAQHARMYQRLKLRPLRKIVRAVKEGQSRGRTVLILSGIRADESSIRAGYKRDTMKEDRSSRVWCNPFYHQSAADFAAHREEFGLPRNPVKPLLGISGECLCGSFAKPGEMEAIRAVDPAMGAYLANLESRVRDCGFARRWGEAPSRRQKETPENFRPMCVGCSRRPRP